MEPRLVTKTIEVIENVPVKKFVEVVESVPIQREIQTYEQQTFTKQMEVTEQVPVMRQITVTEPVHLKKSVEFMEPIITTQTITRQVRPEVTINQEITKSVGPATLKSVAKTEQVLTSRVGQINISEQERVKTQGYLSTQQWNTTGTGLNQQQRLIEGGGSTFTSNLRQDLNRDKQLLQNENLLNQQRVLGAGSTFTSNLNQENQLLQNQNLLNQQTVLQGGTTITKEKLLVQEEKYLQSKPVATQTQQYSNYSSYAGKVENLEDFYSKFNKENRETLQNKF